MARTSEKLRLTPRDRELLGWLGRQRFCEVGQLAAREWPRGAWGGVRASEERRGLLSEAAIEGRLQQLRRAGLVRSERWLYGRPQVWLVTAAGMRAGGLDLKPPAVDLRSYEHDLAVTWLSLRAEQRWADRRILTEREIRHLDSASPSPEYSLSWEGSSRFSVRRHYPDLAVEDWGEEGEPLAVELELTLKGPRRLAEILDRYEQAIARRKLAMVLYIVPTEQIGSQLRVASRRHASPYAPDSTTWLRVGVWSPIGSPFQLDANTEPDADGGDAPEGVREA